MKSSSGTILYFMFAYLSLISVEPKPRQVGAQGTRHSSLKRAHPLLLAPACLECFLEDKELHMVVVENQEGGWLYRAVVLNLPNVSTL